MGFPPCLTLTPPFFPNFFAFVGTSRSPNRSPLVIPIAAKGVVTFAIVDVGERNVARYVALILAVETRQGEGGVERRIDGRCVGGQRREVGAGGCAWLVRPVGTVAVVVVDL